MIKKRLIRLFALACALMLAASLAACAPSAAENNSDPIDIGLPLANPTPAPSETPAAAPSASPSAAPAVSPSAAPDSSAVPVSSATPDASATARPTSSIDASTITGNENIKDEAKLSYEEYRALNKDVVGWIKIKDTNVDYPVVQSHDNEEYLTLTPTLVESKAGSLFVDCNSSLSGQYAVIHGHNMSKSKIISGITRFFISILRGTPLMLQLLAVTYGPYYLFELPVSRNKLIPVVIAFAINYAAYFAEIYRGGIESMPVGQYEAAEVLGYTKVQTFIHVILPQVFKRIMPSITNEVVTLVKDTSMAFTVSYQEMFTIGKQIANSETSFVPFLVAGVFYFVFNAIVDFVMGRVEKRMSYYQ